jgi:hypothetical protein
MTLNYFNKINDQSWYKKSNVTNIWRHGVYSNHVAHSLQSVFTSLCLTKKIIKVEVKARIPAGSSLISGGSTFWPVCENLDSLLKISLINKKSIFCHNHGSMFFFRIEEFLSNLTQERGLVRTTGSSPDG